MELANEITPQAEVVRFLLAGAICRINCATSYYPKRAQFLVKGLVEPINEDPLEPLRNLVDSDGTMKNKLKNTWILIQSLTSRLTFEEGDSIEKEVPL